MKRKHDREERKKKEKKRNKISYLVDDNDNIVWNMFLCRYIHID